MMSYRHILVAVDFDNGNQSVIDKAVKLAKPLGAALSLIHVDNRGNKSFAFGGIIDTELGMAKPNRLSSADLSNKLDSLAATVDYPIERTFLVKGEISDALDQTVKDANIDLIICGHHHDFWSRMKPSSRGLFNTSSVDLLIVPLKN
jgi:universal stress protein A